MKEKRPRMKASKNAVPGYLCFALDPNGPTRQRASYSNERREEVNRVRSLGACLRCQLLKKPCSRGDPCDRCVKAAAKNSASRCLSWMDCVRPSLQKLSIYGSGMSSLNDLALGGVPVLQYFADGDVQLKFDIPFQWNIDELSTFLAGWLLADQGSSAASMVGIMSSASLYSTLSAIIGPELAQVFKILVYTTSVVFNAGERYPDSRTESHDIKIIRYCGGRILTFLESQLRPNFMAKLTRHHLYASFLLLLGTTIASNYFEEVLDPDAYGIPHGQSPDYESNSMGKELVKLLSHYLVYIGQQSGLISSSLDESAHRGFTLFHSRKKPRFTWETPHTTSEMHDQNTTCEHELSSVTSKQQYEPAVEKLNPGKSSMRRKQRSMTPENRKMVGKMRSLNACIICRRVEVKESQPSICINCIKKQNKYTYRSHTVTISLRPHSPTPGWLSPFDSGASTRKNSDVSMTDSTTSESEVLFERDGPTRPETSSASMEAVQILESDASDMMDETTYQEPKNSEALLQEKSSIKWSSIVDYSSFTISENGGLDPHLPTSDLDMDFVGIDLDESWPCLYRIPTPPLDEIVQDSSCNIVQHIPPHRHQTTPWVHSTAEEEPRSKSRISRRRRTMSPKPGIKHPCRPLFRLEDMLEMKHLKQLGEVSAQLSADYAIDEQLTWEIKGLEGEGDVLEHRPVL